MVRTSCRLKHSMEPGDWVIVSIIVCCVGPFPPPWAVPRPLHTPTNFWTYYLFTIAGFFWPPLRGILFIAAQHTIFCFSLLVVIIIFLAPTEFSFRLISLLIFYMEEHRFLILDTWWFGLMAAKLILKHIYKRHFYNLFNQALCITACIKCEYRLT